MRLGAAKDTEITRIEPRWLVNWRHQTLQSRSFARWNPEVNRNRAGSRLLFLAEFLETWIGAKRIPQWIEPEKARRNRRAVKLAKVWRL